MDQVLKVINRIEKISITSVTTEKIKLLINRQEEPQTKITETVTDTVEKSRWEEVFKDPVMTAAMVDRLTHKSYIVNMNGNSYRLKETQEWLSQQ